jgi:hypothetical protein
MKQGKITAEQRMMKATGVEQSKVARILQETDATIAVHSSQHPMTINIKLRDEHTGNNLWQALAAEGIGATIGVGKGSVAGSDFCTVQIEGPNAARFIERYPRMQATAEPTAGNIDGIAITYQEGPDSIKIALPEDRQATIDLGQALKSAGCTPYRDGAFIVLEGKDTALVKNAIAKPRSR